MPPADGKPASIHFAQPCLHNTAQSVCQSCATTLQRSAPGGFLLLHSELPRRDHFVLPLRALRLNVIVPEEIGKSLSEVTDDEIRNIDFIFCDLTHPIDDNGFRQLRRIFHVRRRDGIPVLGACWLRDDCDVEFQRSVEIKLGAKVILCKANR